MQGRWVCGWLVVAVMAGGVAGAQQKPDAKAMPWMDAKLTAEKRAELVVAQMTLDEKIAMMHGEGMAFGRKMTQAMQDLQTMYGNGGAGYECSPSDAVGGCIAEDVFSLSGYSPRNDCGCAEHYGRKELPHPSSEHSGEQLSERDQHCEIRSGQRCRCDG